MTVFGGFVMILAVGFGVWLCYSFESFISLGFCYCNRLQVWYLWDAWDIWLLVLFDSIFDLRVFFWFFLGLLQVCDLF